MITRIISYQYLLEPEMQQNIQKNKDNGWWTGVWELSVSWFQGTDHDSSVQVIMFSQTHDTSWFTKLPVRTKLLWLGRPAGGIESWAWGPPIDSFKTHDVWCVYVLLFCLVDMVVLMSVWPSGLRRWLQVPFYFGRRGYPSADKQSFTSLKRIDSTASPCQCFCSHVLPGNRATLELQRIWHATGHFQCCWIRQNFWQAVSPSENQGAINENGKH